VQLIQLIDLRNIAQSSFLEAMDNGRKRHRENDEEEGGGYVAPNEVENAAPVIGIKSKVIAVIITLFRITTPLPTDETDVNMHSCNGQSIHL
jgi:predicted nucleotidyltransferase